MRYENKKVGVFVSNIIFLLQRSCALNVRSKAVLMNVNTSLLDTLWYLHELMSYLRVNTDYSDEGNTYWKCSTLPLFLSLLLTWNLLVCWSSWELIPERWVCSPRSVPLRHCEYAARGRFDLHLYSNNHNSKY